MHRKMQRRGAPKKKSPTSLSRHAQNMIPLPCTHRQHNSYLSKTVKIAQGQMSTRSTFFRICVASLDKKIRIHGDIDHANVRSRHHADRGRCVLLTFCGRLYAVQKSGATHPHLSMHELRAPIRIASDICTHIPVSSNTQMPQPSRTMVAYFFLGILLLDHAFRPALVYRPRSSWCIRLALYFVF